MGGVPKDYLLRPAKGLSLGVKAIVTLNCKGCGKPFIVERWIANKGRMFCSNECKFGTPKERLMRKISKQLNGCWNWTGYVHKITGYGQIKVMGRTIGPHALSYCLHYGPIPDGMAVLHKCIGNRLCVNPDHLYAGTPKENVRDMIEQGRFHISIGEDCGSSVLTEEKVLEIRALRAPKMTRQTAPFTYKQIGDRFGISWGTARQIVEGLTWKHLLPIDSTAMVR